MKLDEGKVTVVNEDDTQCWIMLDCKQLDQIWVEVFRLNIGLKRMDNAEFVRKVESDKNVAVAIKSLVNAKGLSFGLFIGGGMWLENSEE